MGGLWYEYLYQPEYSTYKFECGTWNILVKNRDNLTDSEPVSFDLLHHEVNKTKNNATSFAMYNYECGTPGSEQVQSCKLEKKAQRAFVETLVDPSRTTQIVATDYFSYAVLSVCQSYGIANNNYFLVLTREKQPSLFARKQILEVLKGKLGMKNE